ncbi:hypothetical protein EZV73_06265 [Acidaminobacter sp. JC074]|uniref:hypothetical protein n=1 Tax=Acidaminobacter sp. JC074 TaxID=2530199 RepID=UPI001F106468|nr:hypothetical protein [Acidaminobacter sp. JC074]MCH4887165.1 hypothetical protein [Acidaminobacter sp. JC074]
MKKVIVLLICLISIVGILLLASKYDKRDFADQKDHALLYGLKDLVDENDIEVLETIEFSHADFKFWGIPDAN